MTREGKPEGPGPVQSHWMIFQAPCPLKTFFPAGISGLERPVGLVGGGAQKCCGPFQPGDVLCICIQGALFLSVQ